MLCELFSYVLDLLHRFLMLLREAVNFQQNRLLFLPLLFDLQVLVGNRGFQQSLVTDCLVDLSLLGFLFGLCLIVIHLETAHGQD